MKNGHISIGKTGLYIDCDTDKGYHLHLSFVTLPNLNTIGINNITKDQMFVLFMDYDNISYDNLVKQVKFIMNGINGLVKPISHILVLETGEDRYHVISFEKFYLNEIRTILDNSLCDYSYKNLPITSDKGYVLRIQPKFDLDGKLVKDKPVFKDLFFCVDNNNTISTVNRKISRAHVELFTLLYPEIKNKIILFKNCFDDDKACKILKYGTTNNDVIHNLGINELVDSKRLILEWETVTG